MAFIADVMYDFLALVGTILDRAVRIGPLLRVFEIFGILVSILRSLIRALFWYFRNSSESALFFRA